MHLGRRLQVFSHPNCGEDKIGFLPDLSDKVHNDFVVSTLYLNQIMIHDHDL